MGWKELPIWLKGGLIGILICLLVLTFNFSIEWAYKSTSICPGNANCYYTPFGESLKKLQFEYMVPIIQFPLLQIIEAIFGKCYQVGCIIYIIIFIPLMIIEYFFVGALIGWIIGKTK